MHTVLQGAGTNNMLAVTETMDHPVHQISEREKTDNVNNLQKSFTFKGLVGSGKKKNQYILEPEKEDSDYKTLWYSSYSRKILYLTNMTLMSVMRLFKTKSTVYTRTQYIYQKLTLKLRFVLSLVKNFWHSKKQLSSPLPCEL